MVDARHFEKLKSRYLRNRLASFDEIWHNDAFWAPTPHRSLKFQIFENPNWQRPPYWKLKNCYTSATA